MKIAVLWAALAGMPIAGVFPPNPIKADDYGVKCVLFMIDPVLKRDGEQLEPVTRPRRRVIVRMHPEDYDAIFSPDCRQTYLLEIRQKGKPRFIVDARRTSNP